MLLSSARPPADPGEGPAERSALEQPVFLVVLGTALVFEAAWRCARGTNAVGRLAAPPRG